MSSLKIVKYVWELTLTGQRINYVNIHRKHKLNHSLAPLSKDSMCKSFSNI